MDERNKDILEALSNSSNVSFSTTLNLMITTLCDAPKDIQEPIIKELEKLQKAYEQSIPEAQYMTRLSLWNKIDICKQLCSYIKGGELSDDMARIEDEKSKRNLTKVKIKNGYAVFPKDWVQLNPEDAENCPYIEIVEINPSKPKVLGGIVPPHFVYFAPYYGSDVNDKIHGIINELCIKKYPPFKILLEDEISTDEYSTLSLEEIRNRTQIGHFNLYIEGEDTDFRSKIKNYEPPYGAKIIRN